MTALDLDAIQARARVGKVITEAHPAGSDRDERGSALHILATVDAPTLVARVRRLTRALERIRGWDDITADEYDVAVADDANTCEGCRAVEIAVTALAAET